MAASKLLKHRFGLMVFLLLAANTSIGQTMGYSLDKNIKVSDLLVDTTDRSAIASCMGVVDGAWSRSDISYNSNQLGPLKDYLRKAAGRRESMDAAQVRMDSERKTKSAPAAVVNKAVATCILWAK